jgi:anaerobic magnesium-protoporphyrin IX monomethyl ester cyclase
MNKKFKVLLIFPNDPLLGVPPSNLALLAAVLKQNDIDIKLFDTTIYKSIDEESEVDKRIKLGHVQKTNIDDYIHPKTINIYEDFVNIVDEYKPNLIGIHMIDSTIRYGLSFVEKIKDKNISVVIGGVASTFHYEKILNTGLVQYACIGEGEGAFVELCNKLQSGEDTTNIRNIYTKNKEGKLIKNSLRPLVDINIIPIADFTIYEDWRFYRPFKDKVYRMMTIDIDRGCPHSCTYCCTPILRAKFKEDNCGNYFRFKNLDKLFEEINYLVNKYNSEFLWISSETFLSGSTKRIKEFADRYIREINLPFWSSTRLDTFTEEKTKLIAEMGCQGLSIGMEHGSEKFRNDILNKKATNKQTIEGFKMMAKYHIHPTINNMIGLPGETREDVFKTFEMCKIVSKILKGNHNINVFTFMPFSGTALRDLCIEKNYIKDDDEIPTSLFSESILNMPSPYLSKEDIKGLEKTAALYIGLPESYYSDIRIAEKDDEEGQKMFNKLIKIIRK